MNLWNNLLRYPKFFISSMLGLILIIITPFIKIFKEFKNKTFIISFILLLLVSLFWILFQMITLD